MPDLVVGFDLDMTLVDSGDQITASLLHAAREHGAAVDEQQARAMVGWPLDHIFRDWLPADAVVGAIASYRSHYAEYGIPATRALPGAAATLQTVRDLGGRSLVVSAKQTRPAEAALAAAGLAADAVVGGRFGEQKAQALQEHGATVYFGDHVGDMRAAVRASVVGVGLATNTDTPEQLLAAGAAVVLAGIHEGPAWLTAWVPGPR